MTGKEIIEMIKEYKAEEYEIIFRLNDTKEGYDLRDFALNKIPLDIGYSDKVLLIDGEEKQ